MPLQLRAGTRFGFDSQAAGGIVATAAAPSVTLRTGRTEYMASFWRLLAGLLSFDVLRRIDRRERFGRCDACYRVSPAFMWEPWECGYCGLHGYVSVAKPKN